ncbi:protein of unknown function [Pseudorhizobium banfieldiae]|uniref:Uncharacterized protein n=1 Tax=Pseudorhizobium banfieldiae TaxID=1125847 RepID=L0NIF1_9HYPH|nr:protein of unknown function [Pseudorhizobium banfieldiae]
MRGGHGRPGMGARNAHVTALEKLTERPRQTGSYPLAKTGHNLRSGIEGAELPGNLCSNCDQFHISG